MDDDIIQEDEFWGDDFDDDRDDVYDPYDDYEHYGQDCREPDDYDYEGFYDFENEDERYYL